jgi:cytoskeletal protein RodZ
MIQDGAVPLDTPVPEDAALRAALQLQVALTATAPLAPGGGPTITGDQGLSLQAAGVCRSVTAYSGSSALRLDFSAAGWISITPDENGTLGVSLATVGNPSAATAARTFTVVAGRTVYLQLAIGGMTPVLSLPAGPSLICGAVQSTTGP